MTLASKYGRPLWDTTPYSREVLVQRWRIRLTSLLLFTVILTELLGAYATSNNNNNNNSSSTNNNSSDQHTHNHHHHHQHRNIRSSSSSSSGSTLTPHGTANDVHGCSTLSSSAPLGLSRSLTIGDPSSVRPVYVNPRIPLYFMVNYTFNSVARSNQCSGTSTAPGDPSSSSSSSSSSPSSSSAHHHPVLSCVDASQASRSSQCLYLHGEQARQRVCSTDPGSPRAQALRGTRLAFCSHHPLDTVLNDTSLVENAARKECEKILHEVERSDEVARRIYCEFEHSLARYDCNNGYSEKWKCADCKAAYKNWVCAMVLPFHRDGVKYDSCRHFCHLVEQQCPYFLPDTRLQYAGESTFLCMDPDIDEDLESTPATCYLPCHLGHSQDVPGRTPCYNLSSNSSASSSSPPPPLFPLPLFSAPSVVGGAAGGPSALWLVLPVLLGVTTRTFLLPPFCLGLT